MSILVPQQLAFAGPIRMANGYVEPMQAFCNLLANAPLRFSMMRRMSPIPVRVDEPERIDTSKFRNDFVRACGNLRALFFDLRRLLMGSAIVTNARVGYEQFWTSLTKFRDGKATLNLIRRRQADSDVIATCTFGTARGVLHLFDLRTRDDVQGRGFNAALQRLAYIMTDRPRQILLHNIKADEPAFTPIVGTFLLFNSTATIRPPILARAFEQRFGQRIEGFRVLDPEQLLAAKEGKVDIADARYTLSMAVDPA